MRFENSHEEIFVISLVCLELATMKLLKPHGAIPNILLKIITASNYIVITLLFLYLKVMTLSKQTYVYLFSLGFIVGNLFSY